MHVHTLYVIGSDLNNKYPTYLAINWSTNICFLLITILVGGDDVCFFPPDYLFTISCTFKTLK